jgi:hypothetical protein
MKILLATDGSPDATDAVEWLSICRCRRTRASKSSA